MGWGRLSLATSFFNVWMNFKTIVNGAVLFIGLGLAAYSQLNQEDERSLVDINNGELWLIPIEKDRYGRTVAEVYVRDSKDTAINLNLQMVRDGYAWHYERYSGNCPTKDEYAIAERIAREEGLGVWNGLHQAPWDYRKSKK